VIGSENDPYCEFERSKHFAKIWGATFISSGPSGHINTASGHGPWPEGRRLLEEFRAGLDVHRWRGA
jgi:predicted alpha/beta hydrolase family esterase